MECVNKNRNQVHDSLYFHDPFKQHTLGVLIFGGSEIDESPTKHLKHIRAKRDQKSYRIRRKILAPQILFFRAPSRAWLSVLGHVIDLLSFQGGCLF